jgi:hypothetical protein
VGAAEPVRVRVADHRHEWGFEPNLTKSSEVEIRFSPLGDGSTRVDLEHRHFERHGAGGATMKTAVEVAERIGAVCWRSTLRALEQAD